MNNLDVKNRTYSRSLTLTPMSPWQKNFVQSPLAEELFAALADKLELVVRAGYWARNGDRYEILHLYVDAEESSGRWAARIASESWAHDALHDQIRDILFALLKKHRLALPLEEATDPKSGEVTARDCFNITLIDLRKWQAYWSTHTG